MNAVKGSIDQMLVRYRVQASLLVVWQVLGSWKVYLIQIWKLLSLSHGGHERCRGLVRHCRFLFARFKLRLSRWRHLNICVFWNSIVSFAYACHTFLMAGVGFGGRITSWWRKVVRNIVLSLVQSRDIHSTNFFKLSYSRWNTLLYLRAKHFTAFNNWWYHRILSISTILLFHVSQLILRSFCTLLKFVIIMSLIVITEFLSDIFLIGTFHHWNIQHLLIDCLNIYVFFFIFLSHHFFSEWILIAS